jgi:hypothetical protein
MAVREKSPERQRKDQSRQIHQRVCHVTSEVKGSDRTWAFVREQFASDPHAVRAITTLGEGDFDHGCRLIANRDQFTSGALETRFRSAYERSLEQESTE